MNASESAMQSVTRKSWAPRRLSAPVSLMLVSTAVFALTGCGPKRMRADFIGFEKEYAETSNREVLLNLARLQNHDSTYFFKLGQISSSYRMNASLTGSGNYVIQGTGAGGNAIGGGSPGLVYENDPAFTFIPVNDDTSAQLLLKPVPAATMYNLYLQGWRIDQLFRLLVDRIEVSTSDSSGSCVVKTFHNTPPGMQSKSGSADPGYLADASTYATFLRVSAIVYGLQKHDHLLLKGTSTFVPYDAKSAILPTADSQAGTGGGGAGGGSSTTKSTLPAASDIESAAAKGESWEFNGKQWLLGQQVDGAEFYLNGDLKSIKADLLSDPDLEGLERGNSLDQVLGALEQKFSVESTPNGNDNPCPPPGQTSSHLVLRSLIGIMAAAAQEQAPFEDLKNNKTLMLPKANPTDVQLTFDQAVPPIERIPALQLKWKFDSKSGPALVEVEYRGTNYQIADAKEQDTPANQYWNRDMFRLINQLTAQVTVDISKFPLPGILRLSTN
jgi:hypothetical protein